MKIFALAALLAGSGFAATIYTNGTPNNLGASSLSDFEQADDFTVSSTSNLTGFRFWSMEVQGAFAGATFWEIRNSALGVPGAIVLASGSTAPTRTFQSSVNIGIPVDVYQNDIAITANGILASTYWLVLHNGALANTAFVDYYWAWTNPGGGLTAQEQDLTAPSAWAINGNEKAFLISGDPVRIPPGQIPEPGAFVLLATGLAAFVLARRRLA